MKWRGSMLALALALALSPVTAAAQTLTLDAVLELADADHPELDRARARQAGAQAELELARGLEDFRVNLDGGLRGGRNRIFDNHFQPDHFIRLNARKTLFDSGRAQSGGLAAEQDRDASALRLLDTRNQRRLTLMARYFDVLLADMRDAADTEFLAVAYIAWDNARERHDLGQVTRAELSELEARNLQALERRNDVRRQLREKRLALGLAMNRAGMVLEDLVDPKLVDNDRALPGLDVLSARVFEHNPRLLAQRRLLDGARHRIEATRAEYRPSLEFEAEAAAWKREATARDDLRAGVNLNWPLWHGRGRDARLARERARFQELQAEHDALEQELRQAVLAAREEIEFLRGTARRVARIQAEAADQALEKARAEYEMELKTHLGTSMAETQMAKLRARAVEYRLALAWGRLDALLGVAVQTNRPEPTQGEQKK